MRICIWSITLPKKYSSIILIIKKISLILHPPKTIGDLEEYPNKHFFIMTKAEIVNEVAKSTGIEKIAVQSVVEAFMETVKGSIVRKEPVYLRGFGSFIVKHRAQKAARNITKKTTMTIPAHDIPAFKPAKVFVNAVKDEK